MRHKERHDVKASMLRKAGLKVTPARIHVLQVFSNEKVPLSPRAVISRMHGEIDQVTVYRAIRAFQRAGIIRQIDLRHNHAHYELVDLSDHHHIVCTSCGTVADIEGCEVEEAYARMLRSVPAFSEIRQHSLEFYGVCKKCVR